MRRASTHRKHFSRCCSAAREATDRLLTAERVVLTAGVRTMPSLNVLQRMKIGNKALMFQARLCCCLITLCMSGSCANAHGVQSRVINAQFMNFASRRGHCRYAGGVHSRYVYRVHSKGSGRNGLCCIVSLFCGRLHTQCPTDTRLSEQSDGDIVHRFPMIFPSARAHFCLQTSKANHGYVGILSADETLGFESEFIFQVITHSVACFIPLQTGKVNQGIVGILQVAGASYVDQSQFNAKSKLADKKAIEVRPVQIWPGD